MKARRDGAPRTTLFSSRLFTRLFLSYAAIIAAAFLCYTAFVLYDAAVRGRADSMRRYRLELQEIANGMEAEILDARGVASRIRSSPFIRDLYLSLKDRDKATDPWTLYKSSAELKSARGTPANTDIYDVLLFLYDDRRVYTSADILVLPERFRMPAVKGPSLFRGSLKEEFGLHDVADLRLFKEFVVYQEDYLYDSASTLARGLILVLFDARRMEGLVASRLEKGVAFRMEAGGRTVLGGADGKGVEFHAASMFLPDVSYTLEAERGKFAVSLGAVSTAALTAAAFLGVLFLLAAYYFSRSYYRPIGRISGLLEGGAGRQGGDELTEIMDGISHLIGERENYRKAADTALPFVRQAALHALLTGDLAAEEVGYLLQDSGVPLGRRFFLVALCNIGIRDGSPAENTDSTEARRFIFRTAEACCGRDADVLVYEKDPWNTAVVIGSDEEERCTDLLYELHERIGERSAGTPYVVTLGADAATRDVTRLPASYRNAQRALEGILVGGRGSVFLFDPESEVQDAAYWFPADAQVQLLKALDRGDAEAIAALLGEILRRNRSRSPWSGRNMRLVLYELYVVTVRVLGKKGLLSSVPVNIEKTGVFTTLEEVFSYYRGLYGEACARLEASRTASDPDGEILAFVGDNCFDPGMALKNVAERFDVSMKYVSTVFRRRLHVSFSRYVHERRMERAMDLLRDPAITMEQLGARCGYSSSLTFRRQFQRATGMNPSDFRREAPSVPVLNRGKN